MNLGVESFIPLVVFHGVLVKTIELQLLFVNYGKGILILLLFQHRLLDDVDYL